MATWYASPGPWQQVRTFLCHQAAGTAYSWALEWRINRCASLLYVVERDTVFNHIVLSSFLRTYLRIKYRHNAREDDVRDAIATLDIPGTESRRKGPDKGRQREEFITPGPDWLWCCDGHDCWKNGRVPVST
jgi:hypothetical protein